MGTGPRLLPFELEACEEASWSILVGKAAAEAPLDFGSAGAGSRVQPWWWCLWPTVLAAVSAVNKVCRAVWGQSWLRSLQALFSSLPQECNFPMSFLNLIKIMVNYEYHKMYHLTVSKCTVQWHFTHSHCCATITIYLQNFFTFSNRSSVTIKHQLSIPLPAPPSHWQSKFYFLSL